eukprot:TRINITY_DN3411_c0_g1_i1.p1 TRINITY_DN3411_c0_g1~~TRINITY_DN3411_c0_g1_i1.p1  ORF type:complete len:103 (+),score=19.60 TRINITY_DN3411_c0_g1_i1:269-577(+)
MAVDELEVVRKVLKVRKQRIEAREMEVGKALFERKMDDILERAKTEDETGKAATDCLYYQLFQLWCNNGLPRAVVANKQTLWTVLFHTLNVIVVASLLKSYF